MGDSHHLILSTKIFGNIKIKKKFRVKHQMQAYEKHYKEVRHFFPLGIGVWGLAKYKHILTAKELPAKTQQEKKERMHAKIQGMLLELGNQRGLDTYTNDKSWTFNNKN